MHIAPFDCAQMDVPALDKVQALLRDLSNSAPGPDGTPCMTWKRPPSAAQVLLDVAVDGLKGCPAPLDFNDLPM
eukprot:7480107-Pyramimonas_sp.AAC.1